MAKDKNKNSKSSSSSSSSSSSDDEKKQKKNKNKEEIGEFPPNNKDLESVHVMLQPEGNENKDKKDKKDKKEKKHKKDKKDKEDKEDKGDKEDKKEKKKKKKQKTAQEIDETWLLYAKMPKRAKYSSVMLIFSIVLACVTLALGILIEVKSTTYLGRVIIVFSAIALVVFGFNLFSLRKFISLVKEYLDDRTKDIEDLDQHPTQVLLNISFYLQMLLMTIFIIISAVCFFFGDDLKSEVDSWYVYPETWFKYFGDVSYNAVLDNFNAIIWSAGAICIAVALLIAVILYFGFKMKQSYRSWQVIVQYLCVLFYLLSFLLVYLAIFAYKYQEIANVEKAIPSWLPILLLVAGCVACLISIIGYVATFMENSAYLKVFVFTQVIFTLFILVAAVLATYKANDFKDYFEDSCYPLMDGVNEKYLSSYLGCPIKYVEVSNTLEDFKCPKDRIYEIWEINVSKPVEEQEEKYGCLSKECCLTMYSSVKNKFNYLVLIGFILFITGVINLTGGVFMIIKLDSGEEEGENLTSTKYMLIIIVVASIIVLVTFICLLPPSPEPTPMELDVINESPKEATEVDKGKIIPDKEASKEETKEITEEKQKENEIKTDDSKCTQGECLVPNFSYSLIATNGKLIRTSVPLPASVKITQDEQVGDKWVVKFEGNTETTENYLKYYDFNHKCQLQQAFTNVKVGATGTEKSFVQMKSLLKSKTTVKTKQEPKIVLDLSKLQLNTKIDLLDFYVSYTLFDATKPTKIRLEVTERLEEKKVIPAESAKIELKSVTFPDCGSSTKTLNNTGVYTSDDVFQLNDGNYNNMQLTVTYKNYDPVILNVGVGGLGSQEFINLAPIEFVNPLLLVKVDINTKVIDTLTNKPVSVAEVKLYSGRFKSVNELTEEEKKEQEKSGDSKSFVQLRQTADNMLIATLQTDENGDVIFKGIGLGDFTIIASKDKYYSENRVIKVSSIDENALDNIPLTPVVKKGSTRFVLSWPNGPQDLDIYSDFILSRFRKCRVFFGRRECGGLKLDVDNFRGGRNGVETISLETMGTYKYLFMVSKFEDVSNGVAPNENADPNRKVEETSKVPDLNLIDSKATISIYVADFEYAIMQISVPSFISDLTVMDPKTKYEAQQYDWWIAFCIDGTKGMNSLKVINKLDSKSSNSSICDQFYQ